MEQLDPLSAAHPNYLRVLRVSAAITAIPFVIAAAVLEFAELLPVGTIIVPVLVLAGYYLWRMPRRRYGALGFSLANERLQVARGVYYRSDTVVPFGRVQHIDVNQGPLERTYDLATLTVHTAGTHNASVSLPGLAHADAVAMRESIREAIRRDTR